MLDKNADREADLLSEQYNNGTLSAKEYNNAMSSLRADYKEFKRQETGYDNEYNSY